MNPAGERNKAPIAEVLTKHLNKDTPLNILEISSGPGTQIQHLAPIFSQAVFQPSEFDSNLIPMLSCASKLHSNILPPIQVDISKPLTHWRSLLNFDRIDVIININMIHISSNAAVRGLFENAGSLLSKSGFLFTYGPYSHNGIIKPDSNISFDQSLRNRNVEWGLRDVTFLKTLAEENGLVLQKEYELPANNNMLVFVKE